MSLLDVALQLAPVSPCIFGSVWICIFMTFCIGGVGNTLGWGGCDWCECLCCDVGIILVVFDVDCFIILSFFWFGRTGQFPLIISLKMGTQGDATVKEQVEG